MMLVYKRIWVERKTSSILLVSISNAYGRPMSTGKDSHQNSKHCDSSLVKRSQLKNSISDF